jgi:hypothetical protein
MQVFTCSEVGGHAVNEDAIDVRPHPHDPHCSLCAVADGQGGRAGGAVAARVACQKFIESASRLSWQQLLLPGVLSGILHAIDQTVSDHPEAGFTTLVIFCITEERLWGASSGDSEALVINAGQPGNILTSRQKKNPPVGSGEAVFVNFASQLRPPWTVLAMTDGVWKYAGWEVILKSGAEMSGAKVIASLRDRARLQGSGGLQDDFTLLVLHNGGL